MNFIRETGALILCAMGWITPSFGQMEPPILRISMENEPVTLDPHKVRSQNDRFILSFLMRGLLKYDEKAKLVCDLCSSFQVQPDGKTLVFDLRPEIWSDGEKLDAHHFVDSFQRLLDPSQKNSYSEEFRLIEGAPPPGSKQWDSKRLGVRAETPARLTVRLTQPSSLLPHLLTTVQTFPIRKALLKGPHNKGEDHATSAVLGPYMLAAWEHGRRIVIEGNPTLVAGRPVYRVEFILGKHADLLKRFNSGKLDILSNPTAEDLVKLQGKNLKVNPYWATRNLIFNTKKPPLSELSFRRAILYSLKRESLPAFLKSGDRAATGLIPPGLPGYRDLPLVTSELVRARTERGRSTAGEKPISLNLLVLDNEAEKNVARWLSEQLKPLQITLNIQPKPAGAFYKDLEEHRFELAQKVWSFEMANPLELLRTFETVSPQNLGQFTHVGFDALIEKALREEQAALSSGIIEQATQTLETEAVGIIPLSYPTQPFLLGRRVINFVTTPFGDPNLVKIQLKQ